MELTIFNKIKISTHLKKTSNAYEITRIISFKKTKPAAKIQPAPLKELIPASATPRPNFVADAYYQPFISTKIWKMFRIIGLLGPKT